MYCVKSYDWDKSLKAHAVSIISDNRQGGNTYSLFTITYYLKIPNVKIEKSEKQIVNSEKVKGAVASWKKSDLRQFFMKTKEKSLEETAKK